VDGRGYAAVQCCADVTVLCWCDVLAVGQANKSLGWVNHHSLPKALRALALANRGCALNAVYKQAPFVRGEDWHKVSGPRVHVTVTPPYVEDRSQEY
jgi:hypothetical protein